MIFFLKRTVLKYFGCSVTRLERIIVKALGCCWVQIEAVLGRGGFNVVFQAQVLYSDSEESESVAIRIPHPRGRIVSTDYALAGFAATRYLASLGLSTVAAGPLYPATIPPIGHSHFSIMPVLNLLANWWNDGSMAAKEALVAGMAGVVLQLYRHPLPGFGQLTTASPDFVGPLLDGAVAVAKKRGMDVGRLSPGPYPTWKKFARSQVQGILLLYGEHRSYGKSIKADCDRVLEWLREFEPVDKKLYLVHPDFKEEHCVFDLDTGKLIEIIDWDFARTGTVQQLAAGFFIPYERDDPALIAKFAEDEEDLRELQEIAAPIQAEVDQLWRVYTEVLRKGGAGELVEYVVRDWQKKYPEALFEKELCPALPMRHTARNAYKGLRAFCDAMNLSAEKGAPLLEKPWKRRPAPASPPPSDLFTSDDSTTADSSTSPSSSPSVSDASSAAADPSTSPPSPELYYSSFTEVASLPC